MVADQDESNFIGSCDAMLHARLRGESFGLAIGEFLFLDKLVVCWSGGYDRNHVNLLNMDRDLLYDDASTLKKLLKLQGDVSAQMLILILLLVK